MGLAPPLLSPIRPFPSPSFIYISHLIYFAIPVPIRFVDHLLAVGIEQRNGCIRVLLSS